MTGHTTVSWTIFREPDGMHWISSGQGEQADCVIADRIRSKKYARLLAASPLLLEALKELMGHEPVREDFQSTRRGDHQFEAAKAAWDRARSAIAAATRSET